MAGFNPLNPFTWGRSPPRETPPQPVQEGEEPKKETDLELGAAASMAPEAPVNDSDGPPEPCTTPTDMAQRVPAENKLRNVECVGAFCHRDQANTFALESPICGRCCKECYDSGCALHSTECNDKFEWQLPDGAVTEAAYKLPKSQKRTAASAIRNAVESARMEPVAERSADGTSSDTDDALSAVVSAGSGAKRKACDLVSLEEEEDHTEGQLHDLAENARASNVGREPGTGVATDIPVASGCGTEALQSIAFPPEDVTWGKRQPCSACRRTTASYRG